MHRTRSTSGAPPPSAHSSHYTHGHHPHAPFPAPSRPPPPPVAATKPQECHICLEDLRTDLVACPCGHVYHYDCIAQALQVERQCPVCRGRASPNQLVRLYLEIPEPCGPSTADLLAQARESHEPQVAALNERLAVVLERLQWQKKQHDLLLTEVKRVRHQSEQLLVDKQTLLHRVGALEGNKQELLSKVAKYQIELSRQAEAARQMAVNQSILNYLNSCDAEALEEEVQNPRELVAALKKACKFRHDQYQKVVKEKMKLKSMVQNLQQQLGSSIGGANGQDYEGENRLGKNRMKSPLEPKRSYSATEYSTPHHLDVKKRKITISPAGISVQPPQSQSSSTAPSLANFGTRADTSTFRSSAYTDVVRPVQSANMPRAQSGFSRSTFNPSQYGSYNLVPSHQPPVQTSDHAVCRRGYDETGKLTNYFIPKDTKRSTQSSHAKNSSYQYPGNRNNVASAGSTRPSSGDRRDYPLTNWLRKGQ